MSSDQHTQPSLNSLRDLLGGDVDRTNYGALLATVIILGCLWMVAEYLRYAWHLNKGVERPESIRYEKHHKILAWLFVECGCIYLASSVLAWSHPLYFIVSVIMWHNAFLMHGLNRSQLDPHSTQEMNSSPQTTLEIRRLKVSRRVEERPCFAELIEESDLEEASDREITTLCRRVTAESIRRYSLDNGSSK